MIKKIEKIIRVGRFNPFLSGTSNDSSFGKNTLIFGKNTYGKSTLTAIFRSISESNPDYIIGRKTFDEINDPYIEISTDNGSVVYTNQSWNKIIPIRIFDSKYVQKNIYSNDCPDNGKQEQILSIILGQKGFELEKKYNQLKHEIDEIGNRKRDITSIYNKTFNSNIVSFADFQKIVEDSSIEQKINEINNGIEAVKNQQNISDSFKRIIDFIDKFNNQDSSCLETILEIKQEKIIEHINTNFKEKDSAIDFLHRGSLLIKDLNPSQRRNCVFCGQELSKKEEELISSLNSLFSSEYQRLNTAIKTLIEFLSSWDIQQKIISEQVLLQKYGLEIEFDKEIVKINNQRRELLISLKDKESNLNQVIKKDIFEEIRITASEIKQKFEPLQKKYNNPINANEIEEKQNIKIKLEIINHKKDPFWSGLCKEYDELTKKYNTIKPLEESCFDEKKKYAEEIFELYETKINSILKNLGAGFILSELKAPQNRRSGQRLFSLKFDTFTSTIPIEGLESTPNFKNTLSDSDKHLLSFAFFIAETQNNSSLGTETIIFDDPSSSYDKDRKMQIVNIIRDLKNESESVPEQIIVLTHDDDFYKTLDEQMNNDKKTLIINYNPTNKTSTILSCDMDEFYKGKYYKNIEKLEKYIIQEIQEIDLNVIREVLEHIIYMKYYIEMSVGDRLQLRRTGRLVTWYLGRPQTDQNIKNIINNDIKPHLPHHAQINEFSEETLGDVDKKMIVQKFIEILPQI